MANTKSITIRVEGLQELSERMAMLTAKFEKFLVGFCASKEYSTVYPETLFELPVKLEMSDIKTGGAEVDGLMHKNYRVEMTVTSPGVAEFDVAKMSTDEYKSLVLDKTNAFRNRAFKKFRPGTKITVVFRVTESSGKRYLISCVETSSIGQDSKSERFEIDDIDVTLGIESDDDVEELDPPFGSKVLTDFYVSEHAVKVFSSASKMLKLYPGEAIKILITGPSGYGKTSISKLFAEAQGLSYMRMNCASIRDPEEWFGHREARDGSTVFEASKFISAVEAGNTLIVLDEFNRLEPDLHNTLYPLLDHDGYTHIYDREFHVGKRTIFVATINVGHQYTGVFELDEANKNRFDYFLEVGQIPAEKEAEILRNRYSVTTNQANEIVRIAAKIRNTIQTHCSVRTTLTIAKTVSAGISIRDAFEIVLLHRIEENLELSITGRKELLDILQLTKI